MLKRVLQLVLFTALTTQGAFGQTGLCDSNADGTVDTFESDQCDWLGGPEAADLNGDGFVDHLDFEVFFGLESGKPAIDEWLAGPEAHDANTDGVIDELDYDVFFGIGPEQSPEDWLAGPDAADLNGDGFIDIADYDLFSDFGPEQSPEDWLAGLDAEDLNGDGFVDIADYDLFFGFAPGLPTLDEWLSSTEAFDVNGDGRVDQFDYDEFFAPGPDQTPEDWLAGPEAEDLNGDGFIDIADFELFYGLEPGKPVTLEEWLAGLEAEDVNDDGTIDDIDYELFFGASPGLSIEEWLSGPDAQDANGDGEIDVFDYELFFGLEPAKPPYDEWAVSPEAVDLDGDGEITPNDYDLYFDGGPTISLEDWLAGPDAQDLDENGFIDEADFDIYLGHEPLFFEDWIVGLDAADVNDDGSVDELDFEADVWLTSAEAEDLDGSGELDYRDFEVYLFGAGDGEFGETPILIDFDPAPGDQAQRAASNARPGRTYELQFNIFDAPEVKGWSVTVVFDPEQLAYVPGSFAVTDFLPGGFSLVRPVEGQLGIGTTIFLGEDSASGTETLATIHMEVLDGFSGLAEVEIVRYGLRPIGGEQVFVEVSSPVTISSETSGAPLVGDFDGDGAVDFPDLFLFAEAFWSSDADFDLSGDGFVDFADLFIFADAFGTQLPAFKMLALIQQHLGLPVAATLEPNYPNPFNSSTTIAFAIPANGEVRLEIFDVLGQKVRTLATQDMPAGLHQIPWDGRDGKGRQAAGGVYFYRLNATFAGGAPAFTDVRKLTLVE